MPERRMRASGSLSRGPKHPINTDQTRISNKFQPERNPHHKEIRCDAANFNKFLDRSHPKQRLADGKVTNNLGCLGIGGQRARRPMGRLRVAPLRFRRIVCPGFYWTTTVTCFVDRPYWLVAFNV